MSGTVNHKDRAHAVLSPSGAHRWMVCTPSARLEEQFSEDGKDSFYKDEGSFAHELAELYILREQEPEKGAVQEMRDGVAFHGNLKEMQKSDFWSIELDDDVMKYVDYVEDMFTLSKKSDRFAELHVEDRFDLSQWVPEGFGTNDAVILAGATMHVIDLKFGKGVKVSAEDNPQLKLYALGALEKHGLAFDIRNVVLHIVQPRIGNYSTYALSVNDLWHWGDTDVKDAAAMAFEGKGEFVPGEHCRFCKAATRCRALAEKNLELVKHEFAEPDTLSDAELLDIYDKADTFVKWANKIQKFVLDEALKGKDWQGFKLVEGRSVRKVSDEAKAFEVLKEAGFTEDKFTNTKLKGIGDLEKLLGKKEFTFILGSLIDKPAGKPALVSEDDPRPAINSIEKLKGEFS